MRTANAFVLKALASVVISCAFVDAQPAMAQNENPSPSIEFDATPTNLSAGQAEALENKLKVTPDDSRLRAQLLGYFFFQQDQPRDAIVARREQVLWMIGNHPQDPFAGSPYCRIDPLVDRDGYVAARELWRQQMDKAPQSAAVIENAILYLAIPDPGAAEDLLKQATAADPNNPQWHKDLANLYSDPFPTTVPTTQIARRALEESEKEFVLTKAPEEKFYNLTDLLAPALACGDKVKATYYAKRLLAQAPAFKRDWNYGNAIHKANLALGRVALASGDIETARTRLLDAGKTPGSPQLDSFGPNMVLARKLLEKGKKDAVLQYLDLCGKFWNLDNGKLDSWRHSINAGAIPDFGANLLY